MPASSWIEAAGCRRFAAAATERHDHVRARAEGGRIAIFVAVLRVVVRDRDGRLGPLREVDDIAEQEALLAGSRGDAELSRALNPEETGDYES